MTAYRFRVKAQWNPRGLWRDIIIGEKRTLEDLHEAINLSFGLDFDHLWFFSIGQRYWNSPIQYQSPWEIKEKSPLLDQLDDWFRSWKETRNAGEITLVDLNLAVRDRLCYLFDYGDEWRFYLILKEKLGDEPSDKAPVVVKERGDKVVQYSPER
ncbi:MAG: hypothetical protein U9M97_04870 [Candidatus Hadarchaeota archaeon]|nr:hypothetical protein [Candidatus Hadarchaeota archaeon]